MSLIKVNLTRQQRRQIVQDIRDTPKTMTFWEVLKEAIRWRLPIRDLIADVEFATLQEANQFYNQSVAEIGVQVDIQHVPVWAELDPAEFAADVVAEWESPPVTVPGDPPTTRARQWGELFLLTERQGQWFAPMSDGLAYFPVSKMKAIQAAAPAAILGYSLAKDLPEAT